MALADAAGAVNLTLQQMLAQRIAEQRYADAMKQQDFQNQRQIAGDRRAQQQLDSTLELTRMQREAQAANLADQAKQRTYAEANTLGDQLPPETFLAANDPAAVTMQQGGRGSLLTPKDAGMGASFQGPMPTGETPESVANDRPRGFLKTASAKQQTDAQTYADKQADNARQDAAAAETARHNRDVERRLATAGSGGADKRQWVTRNGQPTYTDAVQPGDVPYKAPNEPRSITSTGLEKSTLGFFNRMVEAERNARAVEDKLGSGDVAAQSYAPGWLENWLQSPEGQSYAQAQRMFTEARLRKESGAAINANEYVNDRRTNFRVAGDTPESVKQKRKARLATMRGLGFASGGALKDFYGEGTTLDSILKEFEDAGGNQGGASAGGVEEWVRDPKTGKLVRKGGQ